MDGIAVTKPLAGIRVLDLSKVEAGKLELDEAPFDLAELAQATHAAFDAVADAKGLAFELAIDPDTVGKPAATVQVKIGPFVLPGKSSLDHLLTSGAMATPLR